MDGGDPQVELHLPGRCWRTASETGSGRVFCVAVFYFQPNVIRKPVSTIPPPIAKFQFPNPGMGY